MVVSCLEVGIGPHIVETTVRQYDLPGTGPDHGLPLLAHDAGEHVRWGLLHCKHSDTL